ncbi:hypothetical protein [Herpetosiphon giganteus]|uniref:hypothetical protein n=1 Tax=Herpetosiphon giganteus TaxID=2029754 RepID=UPI00195AB663|nr:hypothetical protein [Herpetosiphon giganteus]MBM7845934.1 hypothetical protein [Herpetosiphon giganteus]
MNKSMPMRTTTLCIDTPIDFHMLQQKFRLVKYAVPADFRFMKNKYKFERFHTTLKDQLPEPYHFFSYDRPTPSIYALYPLESTPHTITVPFLSKDPLPWSEGQWSNLPIHLVIKLLQASYFKSVRSAAFVSQNKYYIQAKPEKNAIICLEIEIKGDRKNPERVEGVCQEFKIIGHATRFLPIKKEDIKVDWPSLFPYFCKMSPKDGQSFFRRLTPAEISSFEGVIYRIYHSRSSPASLNFHEQDQPEYTRGYLLYTFIDSFTAYLATYGISATPKVRTFKKYSVKSKHTVLPKHAFGTILIFDNRLNQETIPTTAYQTLLQDTYPDYTFHRTTSMPQDEILPVLILQDYEAEDFELAGRLEAYEDPYKHLYQHYSHIPKQSININPQNPVDTNSATDYLNYGMLNLKDKKRRYDLRFDVCLNQLYLKNLVVHQKSPSSRLPGFPEPMQRQITMFDMDTNMMPSVAFIRKKTYDGTSFHTLLFLKGSTLNFVDLRDPVARQHLYALLDDYELDWDEDIIEPFNKKQWKPDREEEDIKRYDFILAPQVIIELEDIEEQVLYDYPTIIQRQEAFNMPMAIESFKLPIDPRPLTQSQQVFDDDIDEIEDTDSLPTVQEQHQQYNRFLDELAQSRMSVSLNELTSEPLMHTIAQIFNILPDDRGKYNRKKFIDRYRHQGHFLSAKGVDVQSSQGIWFDDEQCFMVGSPTGLQDVQVRAQRIRKFDIYQNARHIEIKQFLEMMAVKFVRHKQYTAYPYFFHLIDLYVEAILKYGRVGEE